SPRASCGPASAGSWNDLLLCLLGQAQVRAYVTSGLGRLLTRTRSSLMIEKSAPRLYQRLIMRCSLSPITSAGRPPVIVHSFWGLLWGARDSTAKLQAGTT